MNYLEQNADVWARHVEEGVCFGHTLEDLIQGQIDAGFLIAGFYEDNGYSLLDKYIPTFFATKAIKI